MQINTEISLAFLGSFVMALVFVLPLELITRNIRNADLGKDCISVHMGTYAICFVKFYVEQVKSRRYGKNH